MSLVISFNSLKSRSSLYLINNTLKASSLSKKFYSTEAPPKTQLKVNEELDQILTEFNVPVRFACGYGSGVFKQLGYDANQASPQVDLIFGVSHPEHWHSQNFKKNPHHYSGMKYLGSNFVSKIQNVGAGIYYNPYCQIGNLKVKYGVVSMDRLINDLLKWETLYLAGRMQKPLRILQDDPQIKIANQINRSIALRASLLMLPETFTSKDLFMALTSISYTGDIRMTIGENPKKIENIVLAQSEFFEEIYNPIIDAFPNLSRMGNGILKQDYSDKLVPMIINKLPLKFGSYLESEYKLQTKQFGDKIEYKRCPELVQSTIQAFSHIVKEPAFNQTVKGLFTAGLTRSLRYVGEKLSKRFQ
ncbi:mitochondrial matrix Mmp37 [Conidiobolus coronatus NRRL 28638]|uniref:Phosphatidate cytidylyltransferase, mitochondrial n=1 Tax=Conidiobolus coronatus (strain ATCC 28846 / CBS 209.66 / NRRL 28638) TaxID=796925 RepID=A0A137P9V9_CONC2|nr:mitochondrial matrix Mmp37 [Conidiobolus coronatus NRRL 28638]|eukprot:KXN71744.1 mitochondrial matrix Mmp37 [Conidiobolus coronatus NRRL 28638]